MFSLTDETSCILTSGFQTTCNFIQWNQTGVTLKINMKMFSEENLPHELLLTARQKSKLRNAFENNISTDIKMSKSQISKIIQSEGFLGSLLSKLTCPLMTVEVSLVKNFFSSLVY